MKLDHDLLTRLLAYDPNTGIFTWGVDRQYNARRGQVAGNLMKRGYWTISVCGRKYYAHQLAWWFVHKEWPDKQIDHINRNRSDNRIVNLRLATQQQNSMNMWRSRQNKSGHKGVCWHKGAAKWMASIKHNGKLIYLGLFDNVEQAGAAYVTKAKELYGDFIDAGTERINPEIGTRPAAGPSSPICPQASR